MFIEQLDVSTAVESLGVWITMDGNQAQQKESMLAQSTKFASQMRSSSCSKNEALYTYSSSFLKSLEYPMEVTRFSEKEWNSIVWPALSASLHAAGMEARFPHAVLYGPEIFQGFGWKHPYFLQEIKHAIVLIEESVNKASQTGQLLCQIAELF